MAERRRWLLVALAATFGAAAGGAVLVAADTPATIQGCVNSFGALRVTADPSGFKGQACSNVEHPVTINQTGPPGPPGATGLQGPPGPGGAPGVAGKNASGAGTSATGATTATTNVVVAGAFTIASKHFVRAEVDCPSGDVATGGSAAVVSPLGESPAFDSPSAGPHVVGLPGHPALGWLAEASNATAEAASLRITAVCAGSASTTAAAVPRLILSRPLRAPKAKAKAR